MRINYFAEVIRTIDGYVNFKATMGIIKKMHAAGIPLGISLDENGAAYLSLCETGPEGFTDPTRKVGSKFSTQFSKIAYARFVRRKHSKR